LATDSLQTAQLREFQRALVPRQHQGEGWLDVRACFRPADGPVGGDFHDTLVCEDGRRVALMGDVTGHGLSSALVMAVSFGAVRESFRTWKVPCAVMNNLHDLLQELGERAGGPRMFSATLFLGVLEECGLFKYVSAGHPAAFHLRDGKVIAQLGASVPPLGFVSPDRCSSIHVQLLTGDRLLLYTDGLFPDGTGPRELLTRVEELAPGDPQALVDELVDRGANDDRTAMLLEYRGQGPAGEES
jgi:serine phosphatase RsbU (regulator of sigma subunit)